MFKKLHNLNDESHFNLSYDKKNSSITYKKNFIKNNNDKKKFSSYGEKFRKKNHLLPTVPNLEIVESDTFIFQGRLASVIEGSSLIPSQTQKHGQGVMFLKNGTLIVGFWDHGFLHGRALIFTPFGGKTIAQFYNGKLNGWAITTFSQKLVVCAIYYENKLDGQKIIFQANQKIWVGSKFIPETNSFKIIHLQKGSMKELPDFIKMSNANELIDLYDQFINNEGYCLPLKEIQCINITESLNYIGYCDEENFPNGLGCIYGKKQFYMGHFREGSLECFGRMIFQNGQIYQGELLNGVFYGQGIYYNPSKNLSTIMSTNRDEQKIIDQQQGYICINSSLSYFKYIKHGMTGMAKDVLDSIYEIIEKYYSRFFIETRNGQNENQSVRSEFGVSQNVEDIEELSSRNMSSIKKGNPIEKTKHPIEKKDQRPWLNFKQQSSNVSPQMASQIQESIQESSLKFHRAYSLDKRQATNLRKNPAQQSIPVNYSVINPNKNQEDDLILQSQISKLKIDRNFSLEEKKSQNLNFNNEKSKAKQNIYPLEQKNDLNLNEIQLMSKSKTLNVGQKNHGLSSSQALTFRNIKYPQNEGVNVGEYRNERKYSHMVESGVNFSPQQSVVSNLSLKVEGMMKKNSLKRKKIFM